VLIVANDDKVFAFGSNDYGVLGFGNCDEVNELTINEKLCQKQIIDFKNSSCHVIARTINGKIYCWGFNFRGVLGNGKKVDEVYKPQLNEYLSDIQIIDICCGGWHSLALTNSGQVYAWGGNDCGQIGKRTNGFNSNQLIPIKVNGFNDEKVVMVSCGYWHSMALTESGRVFSWGDNRFEQLGHNNTDVCVGKPSVVLLSNEISIKKISCGREHSLLLSRDGHIYWFGSNGVEKEIIPKKLTIKENKFIDIASHSHYYISIALSVNCIYYVWGYPLGEEVEKIKDSNATEFESFNDIFMNYFGITYKIIHRLDDSLRTLFSLKKIKYKTIFNELCFISSGNFGIVCKVIDKNSGKTFAIKKVPLSESQKEIISKESKIIAKLRDFYVVQCFDVWIEENYYLNNDNSGLSSEHKLFDKQNTPLLHIQMELCFKTMKQIINEELNKLLNTPLGYYISSELFIELLECVNYLHKQYIIHRDLKPENILISYGMNGRFVKLGDFGLSTFHEFVEQSHTKYLGTRIFTAPEVMTSKHYNTKADVYSLGVIVQELFGIDINK
jgi:alpha-tubulin suppressor-like RCC1 family protein